MAAVAKRTDSARVRGRVVQLECGVWKTMWRMGHVFANGYRQILDGPQHRTFRSLW
jgi:hypothetical protein